jgi:YaaC-like Protein
MARSQDSLVGVPLRVDHQDVPFSLWPTVRPLRRFKLQSRIFTSDPWALMAEGIVDNCPKNSREAALAFRAQAEDFYDAAIAMGSRNPGAKPLLLYYAFLNLGKAFLLTWGHGNPNSRPQHGISEKAQLRQVEGVRLSVHPSMPKRPQLYAELHHALTGRELTVARNYRLGFLMPQILFGHRVWCTAANEGERFLSVQKIEYIDSRDQSKAWMRMHIRKDELAKLHKSQQAVLSSARLQGKWRFVSQEEAEEDRCFCLEQTAATAYTDRPSDALMKITDDLRPYLWTSVLLHPPYRKYYLYLAPENERSSVVPQLLSMYMIIFLLGSITRYQPHQFDRLLDSPYGAHLLGAMTEIPTQYVYLMASELLRREVTRASLA